MSESGAGQPQPETTASSAGTTTDSLDETSAPPAKGEHGPQTATCPHYFAAVAALVVAMVLAFLPDRLDSVRAGVGAGSALIALGVVALDLASRGSEDEAAPEATTTDLISTLLAAIVGGLAAKDIGSLSESLGGNLGVWILVALLIVAGVFAWWLIGKATKKHVVRRDFAAFVWLCCSVGVAAVLIGAILTD